MKTVVCRLMTLDPERAKLALRRSLELNPANAETIETVTRTPVGRRGGPRRLTVVTANRWPVWQKRLTVQFLDTNSRALRRRILVHMNAWSPSVNIRFVETRGTGQVRITRINDGHWSYVGTEILGVDADQPTMNLDGFTMESPEEEYCRVVRHEAGHTLGFDHEHLREDMVGRIDVKKAIAWYDRTQGWTAAETTAQVLTPLSKRSVMGTREADPLSIMCYQVPAEITTDGVAIPGGLDISKRDRSYARRIYPKPVKP
jgi:hypothetical protein